MKVKAKCYRDLRLHDKTGCATISFYSGEVYIFDASEKKLCDGLVTYKEYSISMPQEGIIGHPLAKVTLYDRYFYRCYHLKDFFLLV